MKIVIILLPLFVTACGESTVDTDAGVFSGDAGAAVVADARPGVIDSGPEPIESGPCELVLTRTRRDTAGQTISITRTYVRYIDQQYAGSAVQLCYGSGYGYPGGTCATGDADCTEEGTPIDAVCYTVFANRAEDGMYFVYCGQENSQDADGDGELDPFTGFVATSVTVLL